MSGIEARHLSDATTEAAVLAGLSNVADALAAAIGPADDLRPERRRLFEEARRRNEERRRQVTELAAAMRPGDELWTYDDDDWRGVAVVRSGAVVGHVALDEATVPQSYYELVVRFAGPRATAKELMALRKVSPFYRDTPLQSLVTLVGESPTVYLGRFELHNVEDAERQCRGLGLRTERI